MLDQVKTIKMDAETKSRFEQLVKEIDPLLSSSMAILKLMRYAIDKRWLPGYVISGDFKTLDRNVAYDVNLNDINLKGKDSNE